MESPELYEVEEIEKDSFMIFNGVNERHFFVKWVNYPRSENTWEPRSNLIIGALETVLRYETLHKLPSLSDASESPKPEAKRTRTANTNDIPRNHKKEKKKLKKKKKVRKYVQKNKKKKQIIKKRKQMMLYVEKKNRTIETSESDTDSEDEPIMNLLTKKKSAKIPPKNTGFETFRIPKYDGNIPKSKPLLPQKRKPTESSTKERKEPNPKKRRLSTIDLMSSSEEAQEATPLDAAVMRAITPSSHEDEGSKTTTNNHRTSNTKNHIISHKDKYHTKIGRTKILITCYNCGKKGHLARHCTERNQMKCFKCFQVGHKAQNCPQNNIYHNSASTNNHSERHANHERQRSEHKEQRRNKTKLVNTIKTGQEIQNLFENSWKNPGVWRSNVTHAKSRETVSNNATAAAVEHVQATRKEKTKKKKATNMNIGVRNNRSTERETMSQQHHNTEDHVNDILNDIGYPVVIRQVICCDPFLGPPPLERPCLNDLNRVDSPMEMCTKTVSTHSYHSASHREEREKKKKRKHRKDRKRIHRERRKREKQHESGTVSNGVYHIAPQMRNVYPVAPQIRNDNAPPPPPICPVYLPPNKECDKQAEGDLDLPTIITWRRKWKRSFRIFGCGANIVMTARDIVNVKTTWEGIYVDDNLSEGRQQSVAMSISPSSRNSNH